MANTRRNFETKVKIMKSGFRQWEIAEEIGITEQSLSRWFRHDLDFEQRQKIECAIISLKEKNNK